MVRNGCVAVLLLSITICSGCGSSYEAGQSTPPSYDTRSRYQASPEVDAAHEGSVAEVPRQSPDWRPDKGQGPGLGGDRFDQVIESPLVRVHDSPLSTFSVDVDTASYAKARMYLLQQGCLPPVDAVRIEEFVNYFTYDYAPPKGSDPFAVHVEVSQAPWRPDYQLARVGIKGREIEERRPDCNLVFLLDVSGSMGAPNKLPLVKHGLRMLASQLQQGDHVAFAV